MTGQRHIKMILASAGGGLLYVPLIKVRGKVEYRFNLNLILMFVISFSLLTQFLVSTTKKSASF